MDVKETKSYHASADRSVVWQLLCDPWKIATCLPGAQLVDDLGDNKYKGKIKVKIGPVTTNFDGEVEFTKLDAENFQFSLKGQGADKQGKGTANMEMEIDLEALENGTQVHCSMRISITGRIAQFGARMISAVNNKMFDQFTNNFQELVAKEQAGEAFTPQEDNSLNAGAMVGSIVKDSISGIFKKKD